MVICVEKVYNKLVRDKVPEIISANGEIPITRVLETDEYKKFLEMKLFEEYKEVIEASGKDRLEELADLIEVIRALAVLENSSFEEVVEIASVKRDRRGGFEKRFVLEEVLETE